jgi:A/G-specific adenine glycosylase
MLQQTTVRAVVPYYERFIDRFPDVRRLASARPSDVLASWSGLGYYRRARFLHAAAADVVARHGGRVPSRREELLALPGIGRYTAGAILSIAYGRPEPILDGNVTRVLCRLVGERRDPRRAGIAARLWEQARLLVEAAASPGDLNEALMELGAMVCTPATPRCPACPLARTCVARATGRQATIPPPRARGRTLRVRQRVAVIERDGRLLLRRRPATGLLDGLWEVPLLEAGTRGPSAAGRTGRLDGGGPLVRLEARLGMVRHTVTYRRFEVEILRAAVLSEPRRGGYRWIERAGLTRLPVSSLVGKILARSGTDPRRNTPRRAGRAV